MCQRFSYLKASLIISAASAFLHPASISSPRTTHRIQSSNTMSPATVPSEEYKLRPYDPNTDRCTLEEICANVYNGGDYLPKVADGYVADPYCSFLALAGSDDTDSKGEIVAVANYKRLPMQKSVWIEAVRTHPDHRNKGLASLLVRELVALAREEDGENISADLDVDQCSTRLLTCTIESNKAMQRALQKVGFVRHGTIPTLSFAALKKLPGWAADSSSTPQPLLEALELSHLVSPEAKSIASSAYWRPIASEEELLMALDECKIHGGTSGYLPGLYDYIVPGPSRVDLKQSIEHGLVFTLNISGKDVSGCDGKYCETEMKAGRAILALTRDERISSLKSPWICSIVAHTGLAFEAALSYAHSLEVAKQMHKLQSIDGVNDGEEMNYRGNCPMLPFCVVFDDAVPLENGMLAHALPRVTDECVVFSYLHEK